MHNFTQCIKQSFYWWNYWIHTWIGVDANSGGQKDRSFQVCGFWNWFWPSLDYRGSRSASQRKLNAKWSQGENETYKDSIDTIKMCDVVDPGKSIWNLLPRVNNIFDDV